MFYVYIWSYSLSMQHVNWLVELESQQTVNNHTVQVFRYNHDDNEDVLNEWADHFRNHYCRDTEIDSERAGTGLTRADFLDQMKFPGPSIKSGDFGEILVADYVQFRLQYTVPRTRYEFKTISNESTKGIDVIGFKLHDANSTNADQLLTFEVKCALSSNPDNAALQNAINDSVKDFNLRKPEALMAMKQRLRMKGEQDMVTLVERFQNPVDKPYRENTGAAAILSTHVWDDQVISNTDSNNHPNQPRLTLIVIKGDDLMNLVNDLYQRARDNA